MGWCKTEAISSYKIIQLWNAGQKKVMECWPEEGKVMERWPEEGSVIRCSYQRILRYQYFHYPTLFMNDGVKGYSASEGSWFTTSYLCM